MNAADDGGIAGDLCRGVADYLAEVVERVESALLRGDQGVADRLAALAIGIERAANTTPSTEAGRLVAARWARLRARCRFPSDEQVRDAVKELGDHDWFARRAPRSAA